MIYTFSLLIVYAGKSQHLSAGFIINVLFNFDE